MDKYSPPREPIDDGTRFDPVIICGLHNLGNTCFLNSGVQCLLNVGPFVCALTLCGPRSKRQQERASLLIRPFLGARSLHASFLALIQAMLSANPPTLAPRNFVDSVAGYNPQFEGRQQQDCHELMATVLAAVEDDTRLSSMCIAEVAGSLRPPLALKERDVASVTPSSGSIPAGSSTTVETPAPSLLRENSPKQLSLSSFRSISVISLADEIIRTEELRQQQHNPQGAASNVRPRWIRSAAADVFRGLMLHEITCSVCHTAFRRVDGFNTLSIALPNYSQRMAFRKEQQRMQEAESAGKRSPEKPRSRTARCLGWLWSLLVCIWRSCCMAICDESGSCELGALTLDECLAIHFSPEVLRGSNAYRCDVCKAKTIATHRSSILELPEVLLIQLKRFEGGWYWVHKKSQYVSFPVAWTSQPQSVGSPQLSPMDDSLLRSSQEHDRGGASLDIGPYCVSGPTRQAAAAAAPSALSSKLHKILPPFISTYTLNSVANHHGSLFGGHYTAYVYKDGVSEDSNGAPTSSWVLFNDERAATVDQREVAASQAYVLVYRRQSTLQEASGVRELRCRARQYLSGEAPVFSDDRAVRFISRLWLHRMACYSDPGPILNSICYCDPNDRRRCFAFGDEVPESDSCPLGENRHFHAPAEWFYVPIAEQDWIRFFSVFGGGPEVTDQDYAQIQRAENVWAMFLHRAREAAALGHGESLPHLYASPSANVPASRKR